MLHNIQFTDYTDSSLWNQYLGHCLEQLISDFTFSYFEYFPLSKTVCLVMNKDILAIMLMRGISPQSCGRLLLPLLLHSRGNQTTETLHNHTSFLPTGCFSRVNKDDILQLSVKDQNKKWNHCSDVASRKIEKLQTHQQCPAFWSVAKNEITYLEGKKSQLWKLSGRL